MDRAVPDYVHNVQTKMDHLSTLEVLISKRGPLLGSQSQVQPPA